MHNNRNIFLALAALGGYYLWRNRFTIQRQLESLGVKTPVLRGSIKEAAESVAAKVSGKIERGATIGEELGNRNIG